MKSSTSTTIAAEPLRTTVVEPVVRVTEQWSLVFDHKIDIAVTFESEDSVREYIRRGIEEYGQDPARYGIAVRHQVVTTTAWRRVPL